MKVDIFDTDKKYDIVYTDPPWQQGKGGKKKVRPNSSGLPLDYPTMGISEIKELHEAFLTTNTTERHNVFMWAIDKYLQDAEKFMAELGYKLHARMVWDKLNGPAPAFTVRFCTEYLLWFYKPGNILMPRKECRGKYTNLIREGSREHSRKPDYAYEMLEDMFKDSEKIELFARRKRDGWDCWGNEV